MTMTDLPIVSALKTRLHWHQSRQKVLAENVANVNTPGFRPKDLTPMVPAAAPAAAGGVAGPLAMTQTSPLHLASAGGFGSDPARDGRVETRPSGNAVSIEDEMLKVADNQADYQLAASLYQKSLAMLRTAVSSKA